MTVPLLEMKKWLIELLEVLFFPIHPRGTKCIFRNKLVPPAAVAATVVTASATGITMQKAPMHVRARKLAAKIMTSVDSSPATKDNANAVRVSLANNDNSLVTLIEDVEPACTQDAYELCEQEVKRRKSN